MAVKPLVRKLLKIAGIVMGLLLIVLVVAYLWFVHHAEKIIRDIVHLKSGGTVELSLKSITYSFRERQLNLKEAIIYNTDSLTKKTSCRVSVNKLHLKLHSLTPLLLHRELVIDSILISNPDIRVMKSDTLEKKHGSLSREIGDLYHSIQQALSLFSVGHLRIENGRFSLANRARDDWEPVTISNINFRINDIQVGGNKKAAEGFQFTDDIVFSTDHQQIIFPDGRYQMAFSHFRIHVKEQVVALDSCTIVSTGKHHQPVAVNLFFDHLIFSHIDFPALYASNAIKADSMYALNPVVKLMIKVDGSRNKGTPPVQIDTLLRHLGINTHLKYIGVKNISTAVTTEQNGQTAEFSTRHDDFEMRDLLIDRHAVEPVSVGRFDMAIRGYSSLNKDSTYRFKFDSIRIINSSILLNNFSINSLANTPVQRHHQLPLFELDSLSWEELIFNRRIKAKQAVLYEPEIHYVKHARAPNSKKVSMFSLLNSLDNAMSLERIRVIDGHVTYIPNADTKLLLEQVDLTVQTNRLLAARSATMIGDAVDSLHFEKGSIKTKRFEGTIRQGSFTSDGNSLRTGELTLHDRSGKMTVKAQGVHLDALAFDDSSDHINIGTASWKEATVTLHTQGPATHPSSSAPPLTLSVQKIRGNNTHLSQTGPHHTLTTYLYTLSIDALRTGGLARQVQPASRLRLDGIWVQGSFLQLTSDQLTLNAGDYVLADKSPSTIDNVRFLRYTHQDSITAAIPQVQLVPDLEAILEGKIQAATITLQTPSLLVRSTGKEVHAAAGKGRSLPPLHIGKLTITQPTLHLEQQKEEHTIHLEWNKGIQPARNQWVFSGIRHDGKTPLTIDRIHITGTDLSFSRQSDNPLQLKPQSIEVVLTNTQLATGKQHAVPWATLVDQFALRNMAVENLGRDSGRLHLASLSVAQLALQGKQHFSDWLHHSPHFAVREFSGEFKSNRNYFYWQRLTYHQAQALLAIDSFAYTPVLGRDAYIAAQPWQTDYIQLQTGRIRLHRPDLSRYFKDTLVHIGSLQIDQPVISVYRDKRPPRQPNVIRPLPVNMIKGLPFKLKVDSVVMDKGQVQYEELSEKTNRSGIIHISQLDALLRNIKSYGHGSTDSLDLLANAWLMDSIQVSLRLHESYTDSLAAFYMTTRIGPANLMVLNKVVEPLASVKIRSGYLDTLTLRAIGREYISYGEMKMLYRKLNVQFLQAGDEEKRNFVTRLVTFIANSFVIKSRNQHKTGLIYFERLRDRSIFNYMIKMVLSGAGSSVGAKSNKKYFKHYKRELRRQGLPPVHLE